jgi:hypothetical protein
MKNRLRALVLWLAMEFKAAITMCEYCGNRNASPCSLAHLRRLCNSCAKHVCQVAEQGYQIIEEDVEELWPTPEEEEFPCFDTYPGPAPKGTTND